MARAKTREEKLFAAAVLLRSLELSGSEHRDRFQVVYAGVLRDLALAPAEVEAYLADHRAEVEGAMGRGGRAGRA